jgi:hypothetical protein
MFSRRWIPYLVAAALLLHFFSAVFPTTPVEGDEVGVVNGVEALARGSGDFAAAGYLYAVQPGSYVLLRALGRVTHRPYLELFGVVTAVGSLLFVLAAARLLADLLGVPAVWIVVVLLTAQECVASAYYANTSALADGLVLSGICIAARSRRPGGLGLAAACLAVGGWLRTDALLITPVVLPLRFVLTPRPRAWRDTAGVAAAAAILWIILLRWTGVGLSSLWSDFAGRDAAGNPTQILAVGWLVLGHVATVCGGLGVIGLIGRRRWKLLAVAAAGALLPVLVYAGNFTSPKYFHSAVPFLLLPAVWLYLELRNHGRSGSRWAAVAAVALVLLHLGEGAIGIQSSSPAFRRYDPASLPFAAHVPHAGRLIALGVGEGEIPPTDDGPRLQTGWLWAPTMWREEKGAMGVEQARLDQLLTTGNVSTLVASNYLSYRMIDGWLRAHGYRQGPIHPLPADASSWTSHWQSPRNALDFEVINTGPQETAIFAAATTGPGPVLFLNDRGALAFNRLVPASAAWQRLSPEGNGLVTWYRRAD